LSAHFFISSLDGKYLFEVDDFGGVLVDSLILVGEKKIVGENNPSPVL
jgi:hypothetical protein